LGSDNIDFIALRNASVWRETIVTLHRLDPTLSPWRQDDIAPPPFMVVIY